MDHIGEAPIRWKESKAFQVRRGTDLCPLAGRIAEMMLRDSPGTEQAALSGGDW